MKKKKAHPPEEQEEPEEYKPWLLHNISPQIRKIARVSAQEHNVKLGEWVTHAIIQAYEAERGQTIHMETFAELMEGYPDKEFVKSWFVTLRLKMENLSEKLDEACKLGNAQKAGRKRWWKLWP